MNLVEALKNEANKTYTENGALAYKSSLNDNLDFFAQASLFKYDSNLALNYFIRAFNEDNLLAMKNLFYLRNIRGLGAGLREASRQIYAWLADNHTDIMLKNLENVGFYGRFDDYYAFVHTKLEAQAFSLLKKQFDEDLKSENPSLLAKWLKSPNTSSNESRYLGKLTAKYFALEEKEYRKALGSLREKIKVVERNLCSKDFETIDYERVPSRAMINYRNAFYKNDCEKFSQYLNEVEKGEAKINTGAIYPVDIMSRGELVPIYGYLRFNTDDLLEEAWKNLPNYVKDESSSLVVADTSYSMLGTPLRVAISLALYFAERNKGLWSNKMITFSSSPSFVDLSKGTNLKEKIGLIPTITENTNVMAVFDLILDAAINNNVKPCDMLKNIIVVSDMQFDCMNDDGFYGEVIKTKFQNAGYEAPNLVFWNVNEKFKPLTHATYDERGIKMVSGYNPALFEEVVKDTYLTPLDSMLEMLNNPIFDKVTI